MTEKKSLHLTEDDLKALKTLYDSDKNDQLSEAEIDRMVSDYNEKKIMDPRVANILRKYDTNGDGKLEFSEMKVLEEHISIGDTAARYAAYSGVLARAFRYLAFTSDFGEALRPVVKVGIVNASYAVAIGYCVVDVAWEGYKLKQNNYKTNAGVPMSMTQCIVERSTFQAIASVALPFAIIHTAVDVARRVFTKVGKFTKWGPSVVGLSIIPLLPLYLDEPVEHGIEHVFETYGPWAHHSTSPHFEHHKDHQHQKKE
jgi:fission process protein 1